MANEKRLIDANALKIAFKMRELEDDEMYGVHIAECFQGQEANLIVDQAPTVDAVEVVHGEWEIAEDDYFDLVEMKCSACGESYGFEDYEDDIPKNYHYCPNCGAKMDGERKDND